MNDKPDFLAVGADASMFTKYSEQMKWLNLQVKETKIIDYTDDGRIAFIKYPGNTEMFHYYQIISWQFFFGLFISIVLLTMFMVRHKFTGKKFIETCMELYGLLLSKCMPSSIKRCDYVSRMVLGPVILFYLFTSIKFSNLILDEKVKKIQDKVIKMTMYNWKL